MGHSNCRQASLVRFLGYGDDIGRQFGQLEPMTLAVVTRRSPSGEVYILPLDDGSGRSAEVGETLTWPEELEVVEIRNETEMA